VQLEIIEVCEEKKPTLANVGPPVTFNLNIIQFQKFLTIKFKFISNYKTNLLT